MANIEPVKVINVDGKQYLVEVLDDETKSLVALFNKWNQKEADLVEDVAMLRAAKNDVSGRIILKIREAEAASAKLEAADEAAPDAPANEE